MARGDAQSAFLSWLYSQAGVSADELDLETIDNTFDEMLQHSPAKRVTRTEVGRVGIWEDRYAAEAGDHCLVIARHKADEVA